jgi:hypothetical protein
MRQSTQVRTDQTATLSSVLGNRLCYDSLMGLRGLIGGLLPNQLRLSLRRAAYRLYQHAYRRRSVLDLTTRSREWACREEFFSEAFKALTFNGIAGDYCEFGSHGCTTFRLAYQQSRRFGHRCHLWSFDSFQGFPSSADPKDEHPKWKPGGMAFSEADFRELCEIGSIPESAYEIVPGFYDRSLSKIGPDDPPKQVCLAYIDCDLYSSTKAVLDFLRPRLKHGMIIALDDYYCFSSTQSSGERIAMLEAFPAGGPWTLVPYRPIGWAGMSFILESNSSTT